MYYSFSFFVRTLHKLSTRSISQEELVNQIIKPLVVRYKISDQFRNPYYLDKSRVSLLLCRKADVPAKLREVLNYKDIHQVLEQGINDLIDKSLTPNAALQAVTEIDEAIRTDSTVSEQDANELMALIGKPTEYLACAFILALRKDNCCKNNGNVPSKFEDNDDKNGEKNKDIESVTESKSIVLRSRNDSSVEIMVGDLFAYEVRDANGFKNIIVIPVNTAFDTKTDFNAEKDPFPIVSETTVHGQWIKRMLQSGAKLHELDARIEDAIQVQKLVPFGTSITGYGKTNRYPIGSLVPLETRTCIYLLLAISDFGERNVAQVTPDDLKGAFRKLLEYYNASGQGYKLYMPLMGTGRSRSGLSLQESLDLFLSVVDENPQCFYGNIHIVVRKSDAARITQMGGAQ